VLSLEQALAELPGTAEGIATFLRERGIRGVPENPDCCPIANYLTGLGFERVDVEEGRIRVGNGPDLQRVTTPRRIARFIYRFDHALEWPELVEGDDL